jgi:hypothetical protein
MGDSRQKTGDRSQESGDRISKNIQNTATTKETQKPKD